VAAGEGDRDGGREVPLCLAFALARGDEIHLVLAELDCALASAAEFQQLRDDREGRGSSLLEQCNQPRHVE
jgi:hypothetical protein